MVLWEMNSDYADALRALLKQHQAMMRRQKNPSCGISTVLLAVSLLPSSFVCIIPNMYFKHSFQTATYFLFVRSSKRADKNRLVFWKMEQYPKCIDCVMLESLSEPNFFFYQIIVLFCQLDKISAIYLSFLPICSILTDEK